MYITFSKWSNISEIANRCILGIIIKSEIIYVEEYSDVIMYCPYVLTHDSFQWRGPPELTTYVDKGTISLNVKRIGIIGENATGKYSLIVNSFEESNEGEYQCSTVLDGKPVTTAFNVMLQIRE